MILGIFAGFVCLALLFLGLKNSEKLLTTANTRYYALSLICFFTAVAAAIFGTWQIAVDYNRQQVVAAEEKGKQAEVKVCIAKTADMTAELKEAKATVSRLESLNSLESEYGLLKFSETYMDPELGGKVSEAKSPKGQVLAVLDDENYRLKNSLGKTVVLVTKGITRSY